MKTLSYRYAVGNDLFVKSEGYGHIFWWLLCIRNDLTSDILVRVCIFYNFKVAAMEIENWVILDSHGSAFPSD